MLLLLVFLGIFFADLASGCHMGSLAWFGGIVVILLAFARVSLLLLGHFENFGRFFIMIGKVYNIITGSWRKLLRAVDMFLVA